MQSKAQTPTFRRKPKALTFTFADPGDDTMDQSNSVLTFGNKAGKTDVFTFKKKSTQQSNIFKFGDNHDLNSHKIAPSVPKSKKIKKRAIYNRRTLACSRRAFDSLMQSTCEDLDCVDRQNGVICGRTASDGLGLEMCELSISLVEAFRHMN